MKQKLQSFTIIELLITITLSSMVVLLTYTFYDIVSKQYNNKKKFYEQINEITRLHLEMKDECEKAEVVRCMDNQIYFIDNSGDSVNYRFLDSTIVRTKKETADTLHVKALQLIKKYTDQDVFVGLIDELSFEVKSKGDIFSFHFYKAYAPATMMNEKKKTEL